MKAMKLNPKRLLSVAVAAALIVSAVGVRELVGRYAPVTAPGVTVFADEITPTEPAEQNVDETGEDLTDGQNDEPAEVPAEEPAEGTGDATDGDTRNETGDETGGGEPTRDGTPASPTDPANTDQTNLDEAVRSAEIVQEHVTTVNGTDEYALAKAAYDAALIALDDAETALALVPENSKAKTTDGIKG